MATKEKQPVADIETMSVWSKLLAIRSDFLEAHIKKSGKNIHAEFDYFELKDIVPLATELCVKYNCLFLPTFPDGKAIGNLINLDNPSEIITIEFTARSIAEPAKFRMNEVQGLGAELTYMRRYLYFLLLDLVEADQFDGGQNDTAPTSSPAPKKPETPEKRAEIKKELTASEAQADELQIKALKAALKTLKETDPSKENFIQQVVVKTNKFTNISKIACEKLILTINEMIKEYNDETGDQLPWNG